MMKFQFYPDDPMDKIPAPVGKVILSFLAITAMFVAYIFIWGAIISG